MEDMKEKIQINKKKSRCFRRPNIDSDNEEIDDVEVGQVLEEAKELQKLRKRPQGISVETLASGKKVPVAEESSCSDPFKLKSGGLVDLKAMKSGKARLQVVDVDACQIGTAFSAETNRRDEDAEMMKYIEEQVEIRKGSANGTEEASTSNLKSSTSLEDALYELPEHLRITSNTKRTEEMLSNQMLSGIPEIDLGIEAKIKNIEATEEAKQKLIRDRMSKRDLPSKFVPTNMAVNFVQHNRFNIDDGDSSRMAHMHKNKQPNAPAGQANQSAKTYHRGPPVNLETKIPPQVPQKPVVMKPGERPAKRTGGEEKATDDFHFEKFRKQFRRY